MDFLTGFFIQLFSTAGIIFIFGWLIALLRRAFCAVSGRSGPKILLATGIVGTPIHELSHALMCLLFGHKITEIKLYQPKAPNGALGYVSHTYSKKNIYHQIGNFFIGTAPIILGGGVIVLLMLLLIPDSFDTVKGEIEILSLADMSDLPIAEFFSFIWSAIVAVFSAENLSSTGGWVFIVLALMISSHMEMSGPDIKSGLKGLLFLSILLLLVDGVMYLLSPEAFALINSIAVSFGLIIAALLSISILFLTWLLLIAILFRGIGMLFGK